MKHKDIFSLVVTSILALLLIDICSATTNSATSLYDTTLQPSPDDNTSLQPVKEETAQHDITHAFGSVALRKCRCDKNEALDNSVCSSSQSLSEKLIIPGYDGIDHQALFGEQFATPVIEEPTCSGNCTRLTLIYGNKVQFYVLPDGSLYCLTEIQQEIYAQSHEYCLEHTVLQNETVELHAKVNVPVPPPMIPRCCSHDHYLLPNGSCTYYGKSLPFSPPFVSNKEQWSFTDHMAEPVCTDPMVLHQINLDGEEGLLSYNHPVPDLHILMKNTVAQEYCVAPVLGSGGKIHYTAEACVLDKKREHILKCNNTRCVRKCCDINNFFYADQKICILAMNESEIWQPAYYHSHSKTPGAKPPKDKINIITGQPLCSAGVHKLEPDKYEFDRYYLLDNGLLHIPNYEKNYPPTDYCVDLELKDDKFQEMVLLCAVEDEVAVCHWRNVMVLVLMGISCVFLVATLGVYLGVPDLRDRTNGRCLISMVSAMLTTYISILINNQEDRPDAECFTLAFFGHFSSLATFFWLNVMCFEMWSTLRSSKQHYNSTKVFLVYSLYAWGCPLVIAIVALLLDYFKVEGIIRPHYLEATCWLHGDAEYWLYLAGIIFLLVIINMFFFIHVAFTLAEKLKERRNIFSGANSQRTTKDKDEIWLYVKLSIVMGVVWLAEALSSIRHRNTCSYWVITDIINGLQGVLIFLVAVCNQDNMKKIRAAWRPRVNTLRRTIGSHAQSATSNSTIFSSEYSRKTSVTSIPTRKCSMASSTVLSAVNEDCEISDNQDPAKDKVAKFESIQLSEIK